MAGDKKVTSRQRPLRKLPDRTSGNKSTADRIRRFQCVWIGFERYGKRSRVFTGEVLLRKGPRKGSKVATLPTFLGSNGNL